MPCQFILTGKKIFGFVLLKKNTKMVKWMKEYQLTG